MYVKTDYDGCPYITAGKVYEMKRLALTDNGCITDDRGRYMFVDSFVRAHESLGGRIKWTICDKEGNEI